MPRSPGTEPLEFDRVDDIAAAIRARGGRLAAARRLILETLFDAEGPISAELISERVATRGPVLGLTSVYRNLERLESLGAIRHVHLGHGPGLYALVGGGEREYLACERCDRVLSVDPQTLDSVRAEIRERFGYVARFSHFPVTGLCPDCAWEAGRGARKPAKAGEHEHGHGDRIHVDPHSHEGEHEHTHGH